MYIYLGTEIQIECLWIIEITNDTDNDKGQGSSSVSF